MNLGPNHLINADTRYCAVFGHPVRHSASPAMHNPALAELGLNWRYLALEVAPDSLPIAIRGAQEMGFIGLNLTLPHKIMALDVLDIIDETARSYGAVNTVVFEGRDSQGYWHPLSSMREEEIRQRRSHGFNTDAQAISQAIEHDLSLSIENSTILLLGAGGAGRVAALQFASKRARKIYLVNRSEDKALALAKDLQERFPSVFVVVGYPSEKVDLLCNATSLGLKPNDPFPLDLTKFRLAKAFAIYDTIYQPPETELLRKGKEAGCRCANGASMLLYQGMKALELWTGKPAPEKTMREALLNHLYPKPSDSQA